MASGWVVLSMRGGLGAKKLLILYLSPQHSQLLLGAHREGSLPFSAVLLQTNERPKLFQHLQGLAFPWPGERGVTEAPWAAWSCFGQRQRRL